MYIRVLCTIIYQSDNLALSASDISAHNLQSRSVPDLLKVVAES